MKLSEANLITAAAVIVIGLFVAKIWTPIEGLVSHLDTALSVSVLR